MEGSPRKPHRFPRADFLSELDAPRPGGWRQPDLGCGGAACGFRAAGRQARAERRIPRFLLDQPVTAAGRHPDSDIFLDDVTVSRRHAEFRLEGSEFQVVDVGSLNGTYVSREPVDSAVLVNGDEVQVGSSAWYS